MIWRRKSSRAAALLRPGLVASPLPAQCRFDYELESGIFIGCGNAAGEPIAIADAESHMLGTCLLNDCPGARYEGLEVPAPASVPLEEIKTTMPWIVPKDS